MSLVASAKFVAARRVDQHASRARYPDSARDAISGAFAFRLYDEQGFPLDLTELMARERGLTVDTEGFEKLMEEQRDRARKAQKKSVIEVADDGETAADQFSRLRARSYRRRCRSDSRRRRSKGRRSRTTPFFMPKWADKSVTAAR